MDDVHQANASIGMLEQEWRNCVDWSLKALARARIPDNPGFWPKSMNQEVGVFSRSLFFLKNKKYTRRSSTRFFKGASSPARSMNNCPRGQKLIRQLVLCWGVPCKYNQGYWVFLRQPRRNWGWKQAWVGGQEFLVWVFCSPKLQSSAPLCVLLCGSCEWLYIFRNRPLCCNWCPGG